MARRNALNLSLTLETNEGNSNKKDKMLKVWGSLFLLRVAYSRS
jgi:hypothetical protein